MSREITISELPNHPALGVHITICTNSETVCDGRDLDNWHEEATRAATCAAAATLLVDYEVDSFFANWHGGKFCRSGVRCGHVVADLYRREITRDEEGDEEIGGWKWCGREGYPAEALAEVEAMLEAASDAHSAALDAEEARVDQLRRDARPELVAWLEDYGLDLMESGEITLALDDDGDTIYFTASPDDAPDVHAGTLAWLTRRSGRVYVGDDDSGEDQLSGELAERANSLIDDSAADAADAAAPVAAMVPITRESDSLTETEIAELRALPSAKRRKSWLYHRGVRRSPALMRKIAGLV